MSSRCVKLISTPPASSGVSLSECVVLFVLFMCRSVTSVEVVCGIKPDGAANTDVVSLLTTMSPKPSENDVLSSVFNFINIYRG